MTMANLQAVRHRAHVSSRVAVAARRSLVLPDALCNFVIGTLDDASRGLVALGVSANTITSVCIGLGIASGVLLGVGCFWLAGIILIVASLGDALDGLVARRGGTVSVGGALLDASGDRYQEFFCLGGLAVYFRAWPLTLVATLLALAGSFMVSYSSAKAEALGVPVPPGVMRRAERAVCLCLATVLTPPWAWLAGRSAMPGWTSALPLLVAVALIAVVANASAIRRLRLLGRNAEIAGRAASAPGGSPPG